MKYSIHHARSERSLAQEADAGKAGSMVLLFTNDNSLHLWGSDGLSIYFHSAVVKYEGGPWSTERQSLTTETRS
jgi:hypothetical protein